MRLLATDVGGTHARAAGAERRGKQWHVEPVADDATPDTLDGFLAWAARHAAEVEGIALAIAGVVPDHRAVQSSPNVAFIGRQRVELASAVEQRTGKPCRVFNDMEAALAGELVAGVLAGTRWAFMDTISTGWGGALLLDGEIIPAEPGHTPTGKNEGRRCGLQHLDCQEAHFSGAAVEAEVRRILTEQGVPLPKDRSANALADAAVARGEPWAVALYRSVAEGIGRAWVTRLNLLPPIEKIAYQGGFLIPAMELPLFRDTLRATVRAALAFPERHADIPIERARAPHGALLGAASLFRATASHEKVPGAA